MSKLYEVTTYVDICGLTIRAKVAADDEQHAKAKAEYLARPEIEEHLNEKCYNVGYEIDQKVTLIGEHE